MGRRPAMDKRTSPSAREPQAGMTHPDLIAHAARREGRTRELKQGRGVRDVGVDRATLPMTAVSERGECPAKRRFASLAPCWAWTLVFGFTDSVRRCVGEAAAHINGDSNRRSRDDASTHALPPHGRRLDTAKLSLGRLQAMRRAPHARSLTDASGPHPTSLEGPVPQRSRSLPFVETRSAHYTVPIHARSRHPSKHP